MDKRFNLIDSLTKVKQMSIFNVCSFVVFLILLILFTLVSTSSLDVGNYEMTRDSVTAISVFMSIVAFINLIISVLVIVEAGKIRSSRCEREYNDLGSLFTLSIMGFFVLGSVLSIVMVYLTSKVIKYVIIDNPNRARNNESNVDLEQNRMQRQEVNEQYNNHENHYQQEVIENQSNEYEMNVQQAVVTENVQDSKEQNLEERLAYIDKLKADGDISNDEYESLREYILDKYSR